MPNGLEGRSATLAVAPAHDLSGSGGLDSLVLSDIFASELAKVPGISVVPVSQTLSVMYGQGWRVLSSAQQTAALGRMVGADGVVVLAVTEYDPYEPPTVGLIAELYLVASQESDSLAGEQVGRMPAPSASRLADPSGPVRQVQLVIDGSRKAEQQQIRRFAKMCGETGPYGWRAYLTSQRRFLRYCCWRTIGMLLGPEG